MQDVERQQQGKQAVRNGTMWQEDLVHRLQQHGYQHWHTPPTLISEPYFVHPWHSPYRTIYGTVLTVDFYIVHPWKYPNGVVLETKYQETSGSVDEKLPYTILNLKRVPHPVIFILMGKGFRVEALDWCVMQGNTQLRVLTHYEEWIALLNKELL